MSDFSHKHLFASMVCCLMLALLLINDPSAIAAKKSDKGITPSELQSKLMSFSDRFAARVSGATIEYLYIKGYAKSPLTRFAVTSRRLHACAAAVDIASSANPETALLNMATLVSLLRLTTQDLWVKKNLVPHSQIFLNVYIELEKDIWSIVHSVLSVKQATELRTMINEWHEKNIHSTVGVTSIRFADFANNIHHSTLIHDGKPGGFLKETNKQIEQTRILAERTVFIAEREPTLIRWQTEQVFFDLAMEPEFKAMVNNSGNIGRAAQRLANFTKKMPKAISKERSEAITQAMSAISRERQASIKQLISEVSIERKALIKQTSKDVVVKAFYLGSALIALLLVGAIIARLIYRYLELKLFERRTHLE